MFVIGPLWFVATVMVAYICYLYLRPRTVVTVIPNRNGPAATEWVTYTGVSPPLRLKICFAGSEAYRHAIAQSVTSMGCTAIEQLTEEQEAVLGVRAFASTFVVDWEMVGRPYVSSVMAEMLAADVNLFRFLFNEVKRRSEFNGPPEVVPASLDDARTGFIANASEREVAVRFDEAFRRVARKEYTFACLEFEALLPEVGSSPMSYLQSPGLQKVLGAYVASCAALKVQTISSGTPAFAKRLPPFESLPENTAITG